MHGKAIIPFLLIVSILKASDYWAYQPVLDPPVPRTRPNDARNPIDAFLEKKLQERGKPSIALADKATLLRRVYLDLIGLLPTPQQTRGFLTDNRPDAFERIIDKLLASPRHGERWGRHWLDLARYADSSGYHDDLDRPNAWRYRDYVVDSLNADKSYGRFVIEQIAGDEFRPGNLEALTATGFCRNGPSNDNNVKPPAREQYRLDQLDDTLSTATSVFLGLTVGCARCHDHISDPIKQSEYYGLLAFFNTAGPSEHLIGGASQKDGKKMKAPAIRAFKDSSRKPRPTYILFRGDANSQGPEVQPSVPSVLKHIPLPTETPIEELKTTGRRLKLARWIATPQNPLTWRVIVNRLWQYHHGTGIVATPSNFGADGKPPTHPALLDHLASHLLQHNGHLKHLHRHILTSAAYRRASKPEHISEDITLFGQHTPRRLEAEVIRDCILQSCNNLNLQMYGPGIKPRIESNILSRSMRNQWPRIGQENFTHWRRSTYVYIKRQLLLPMLELFDAPTAVTSCDVRSRSTVPTQALALLNNPFVNDQANLLAKGGKLTAKDFLERTLARPAQTDQLEQAQHFLRQRIKAYSLDNYSEDKARQMALTDLAVVLFNSSEFIYCF